SVVLIFRDEERFLPEAVASVEAQTGVSWELLLVDDGSADASSAWARARAAATTADGETGWADGYPRITYLEHPGHANRGMSASRNLGIGHAAGRWVTFLDADDTWLPGKLAAQVATLAETPEVDVLVSPALWWHRWEPGGSGRRADWVQHLEVERSERGVVPPPALLERFLHDEWASICDLVISADALRRVGGYEEAFRGMYEDQVFHAKVFSQLPAVVTNRWWYRYRQHDSACTTLAHRLGGHRRARLRFLAWLDRYLRSFPQAAAADARRLRAEVRAERRSLRLSQLSPLARFRAGGGAGAGP
ncbi:MAG: glycosyltransferase family 2 protein, partial [Acidimicrobiia bacterium]|nr:glycosyltransferase family 2 protein [Acidimicrobiia bacterium]